MKFRIKNNKKSLKDFKILEAFNKSFRVGKPY